MANLKGDATAIEWEQDPDEPALGSDPLDEQDLEAKVAELGQVIEEFDASRNAWGREKSAYLEKIRELEQAGETRPGHYAGPVGTDRSRDFLLADFSDLLDEAWDGITASVARTAGTDPTKLTIGLVWKADDEGVVCEMNSKFAAAKETRSRRAKLQNGQLELF